MGLNSCCKHVEYDQQCHRLVRNVTRKLDDFVEACAVNTTEHFDFGPEGKEGVFEALNAILDASTDKAHFFSMLAERHLGPNLSARAICFFCVTLTVVGTITVVFAAALRSSSAESESDFAFA